MDMAGGDRSDCWFRLPMRLPADGNLATTRRVLLSTNFALLPRSMIHCAPRKTPIVPTKLLNARG